jgi:serine/threonine-protein kinase
LDSAVDALAFAHAQGVVHRDLNPGNLFLARTRNGVKLKVLDFGVAKIIDDSLEMGPRAQTIGHIRIFSPAYGAPEQFDDSVGPIGPWTDVYALALIMLEALRDQTVMEGEHLGDFAARALDPDNRPTPRALGIVLPHDIEAVLARAVAIVPSMRPQDAGEFWGVLKNAIRRQAEAAKPPSPPTKDLASTVRMTPPRPTASQRPEVRGAGAGDVRRTVRIPRSSSSMLASITGPPSRPAPDPESTPASEPAPHLRTERAGPQMRAEPAGARGPEPSYSPLASSLAGAPVAPSVQFLPAPHPGDPGLSNPPVFGPVAPSVQQPAAPVRPPFPSVPPPGPPPSSLEQAQVRKGPSAVGIVAIIVLLIVCVGGALAWLLLRRR